MEETRKPSASQIDYRSALAKARDAWFDSEEGKETCGDTAEGQCLHNRLELAFLAGAKTLEQRGKDAEEMYVKNVVIIPMSELVALTKLNCDHVIFSSNEEMHCDKNNNDVKRGACCNSCWTRKWAKQKLKLKD